MQKIILFYKFAPLVDPEAVRLWQRSLGEQYNLKGRILISEHGINGTLGGDMGDLKAYVKTVKSYKPFAKIAFKWSDGSREDFPKLVVKVRDEIVTFGVADEITVDEQGIVGGGKHLKPEQVHELVAKRGQEVVFFDGRNAHEAAIGRFKNAVVPKVEHSREFVKALESGEYDNLKDKPVVTYCTGGIRCEILSLLMKNRGFQEVYQIDGGIVKYGETYGDQGLWEGSLYVFDGRIDKKFSAQAKDIGACVHCGAATSQYANCASLDCNALMLLCEACNGKSHCPQCLNSALYNDAQPNNSRPAKHSVRKRSSNSVSS